MKQKLLFGPIRKTLRLVGHCPAKKNLWTMGKRGMYINQAVRSEIDWITLQARQQWGQRPPVEHPAVVVTFYVRNRISDRDNKLTTILDCLRAAGVIVNDNTKRFNGPVVIEPAVVMVDPKDEQTLVYIEVE